MSISSSVLLVLSVCPSVVEWYAVDLTSEVPKDAVSSKLQAPSSKKVSLSLTIWHCTPCALMMVRKYSLATPYATIQDVSWVPSGLGYELQNGQWAPANSTDASMSV